MKTTILKIISMISNNLNLPVLILIMKLLRKGANVLGVIVIYKKLV